MKVTIKSFARHAGIAEATFGRWVRQAGRVGPLDRSPSDAEADARAVRSKAKKALRDPEQRKAVIEDLTEKERLAIADEALRPTVEKGETEKRNRRAIREETSEDPSETAYRIIRLDLAKVDDALRSAINVARDSTWPEDRTERLIERIAFSEELVSVLKLAVSNEGDDVDWDGELRKLEAASKEE